MTATVGGGKTQIVGYGADWIRLPLRRPYVVAYDAIEVFDAFITMLRYADGTVAYGEACPVPGYSSDTQESLWRGLNALLPEVLRHDRDSFAALLGPYLEEQPFLVASLMTPLEWPAFARTAPAQFEIPLIGTILGATPDAMQEDVRALLAEGYRTLKMKVGWDVGKDLGKVATVQAAIRATGTRPFLRIDANQGYTLDAAQAFLRGLDPEFVQLFEQPVATGDWDAIGALHHPDVPVMLDESIVDLESIRRAAACPGVGFVKFKLMKSGSFALLEEQIGCAREHGLRVVLGNGVASDVGCFGEAVASAKLGLDLAGEMNGFLKPRQRVVAPMSVAGGALAVRSLDLRLDEGVLADCLVDRIAGS